MKKVLFIYPFIPINGTSGPQGEKNLTMNLMDELLKEYEIDLFVVSNDMNDFKAEVFKKYPTLNSYFHFKKYTGIRKFFLKLKSIFLFFPSSICLYKNYRAVKKLEEIVSNYDIVHYDYFLMSEYFKSTYKKVPSLLYSHDAYSLNYLYMTKEDIPLSTLLKYKLKYLMFSWHERMRYQQVDKVITVSNNDSNFLKRNHLLEVDTLNNFIKSSFIKNSYHEIKKEKVRVLFTSPFTNETDKILVFDIHKTFLSILIENDSIDEIVFWGRNIDQFKGKINHEKVKYISFVDNYRKFLYQNWIYIYLRNVGSGQHGKVLDAMGLGLPTIGFKNIISAFDFKEMDDTIIVDNLEGLFYKLSLLIKDEDLRARISQNGFKRIEEDYTEKKVLKKIGTIYESLLND